MECDTCPDIIVQQISYHNYYKSCALYEISSIAYAYHEVCFQMWNLTAFTSMLSLVWHLAPQKLLHTFGGSNWQMGTLISVGNVVFDFKIKHICFQLFTQTSSTFELLPLMVLRGQIQLPSTSAALCISVSCRHPYINIYILL